MRGPLTLFGAHLTTCASPCCDRFMCARMTDLSVCQDNTNNEDNTAAAPVAKKEENTVPLSPTRKLSVASKIGHARLRQRMPSIHLRSMRESQLNVVAHIAGKDR